MEELLNRLNQIKSEIENTGYTFNIYDKTLKFLLSSKTKDEFVKKYSIQYEDGRNSIEFDDENFDECSLEELKNKSIETVIEYSEVELENIQDELND
jgi:hypothetical protein